MQFCAAADKNQVERKRSGNRNHLNIVEQWKSYRQPRTEASYYTLLSPEALPDLIITLENLQRCTLTRTHKPQKWSWMVLSGCENVPPAARAHDFSVQILFQSEVVSQRSQPMSWIIAPAARRERIQVWQKWDVLKRCIVSFFCPGEPHGWHLGRCWFGLPGTRHCPWGQEMLGGERQEIRTPFVLVQACWV